MLLLTIRFAAELAGVVAIGYAASTLATATPWRIALGLGAAVAFVVAWAIVVAPKASNPIPPVARELIGTAALVLVAGALVAVGQPGLGVALAAVVLVDQALLLIVRPELPEGIRAAGPRG